MWQQTVCCVCCVVCSRHLGQIGLLLLRWESAVLTHSVRLHKCQYLDAISDLIECVTVANGTRRCLGFFQKRPFSNLTFSSWPIRDVMVFVIRQWSGTFRKVSCFTTVLYILIPNSTNNCKTIFSTFSIIELLRVSEGHLLYFLLHTCFQNLFDPKQGRSL